jgi:hypothetical protein
MPCRPLKSVNFNYFKQPREVVWALDQELLNLAEIAAETDFSDVGQADQFRKNVTYVKGYFERIERLTREQTP